MTPRNDGWQEYGGYWQNLFIHENVLPLGYTAWHGFITQGRGLVACAMATIDARSMDWARDVGAHTLRFVPLMDVSAHGHMLHLEAHVTECLIDRVYTYDPIREILLSIHENGKVDISLLCNLKVSPGDCYRQVRRRWSEFQLDCSPQNTYEQKP
jgi:hypothetical protein